MINKKINDLYLEFFTDCIPVKGAVKSAIYDLTRQEIIRIPTVYYELLQATQTQTIGEILENLDSQESINSVHSFIEFLINNEMVNTSLEPNLLPKINEQWEFPCEIQNAIIDVDKEWHDFTKIITQLDELGCEVIQLRIFSKKHDLSTVSTFIQNASDTSIQGVELLLPYDISISHSDYLAWLEEHPLIAKMTVHSAPEDESLTTYFGVPREQATLTKSMEFITKKIDSEQHCGMITKRHLNQPTTQLFLELKTYNGCLNKKISIDSNGLIKNCPSMNKSYGNHKTHSLKDAIKHDSFKSLWGINKDQIMVCKDCELRYACSDCRAYISDTSNAYSKPLKCSYDPYQGEWQTEIAQERTQWKVKPAIV